MKELIEDKEDKDQFAKAMNEVEIMKALRHRNIIGYIDSFLENNHFYIIMPIAGKY